MIYPTNSNQKSAIRNQQSGQEGVTLLLAILILSSILAIAFSIATILFIEVRSSSDLIRTEPAIYGAAAIGEEAIFKIKRSACSDNSCFSSQLNNSVNIGTPVETLTTTPIFQDKIAPNSTTTYNFYDAVLGPNSTDGSQYGKLILHYLDNGSGYTAPLTVYLCQFNPKTQYSTTACTDFANAQPYWPFTNARGSIIYPNTPVSYTTWDAASGTGFDPNLQQQLILVNPNNTNIYVSIETFGPSTSYVPKGLPYAGQVAVEVNVSNASVGRKVRVIVPNSSTDTSPNTTPTLKSQLLTGSPYPFNLFVLGNYLFSANWDEGNSDNGSWTIYDVSTPSSPAILSTTGNASRWSSYNPTTVTASGNYAYVGLDDAEKLEVYNITNPNSPSYLCAASNAWGYPQFVRVVGSYAYVGTWGNVGSGLRIMSIPGSCSGTSAWTMTNNLFSSVANRPREFAISGTKMYVPLYGANRLFVIDISSLPTTETGAPSVSTDNNPYSIALSGNYALVTNRGSNTLQAFDISGAAPTLAGSISTGANCAPHTVVVKGSYAFVSCQDSNSVQIVNISQLGSGTLTEAYRIPTGSNTNPVSLAITGQYLFVGYSGCSGGVCPGNPALAVWDLGIYGQ